MGTAPPEYPTPPPRAVTGKRDALASRKIAAISSVERGNKTASGGNFSLTASCAYGSIFSASTMTCSAPTISRSRASTLSSEALVRARPAPFIISLELLMLYHVLPPNRLYFNARLHQMAKQKAKA
jgi:hypothetical protein